MAIHVSRRSVLAVAGGFAAQGALGGIAPALAQTNYYPTTAYPFSSC